MVQTRMAHFHSHFLVCYFIGICNSLEFSTGTSVEVFGTNIVDPLWRCYIDDLEIPSASPYPLPENNWRMCGVDNLLDKEHTLTVRVESRGQTFWFDYLLYVPSANAALDNSVILVPDKDPSLIYGSEWEPLGDSWTMTRIHGASMSFQFT